jgi:predicted PhzF superfamily epimerase YddE/YHI9
MKKIQPDIEEIKFGSRGGELIVRRENDYFMMDFPVHPPENCNAPKELIKALGQNPVEILSSNYYLAVFKSEDVVRNLKPYMTLLKELDRIGVVVTAPGKKVDFVSRFFAPAVGIPEDPVTGSAHCTLIPYWANKLGKTRMTAKQVSSRGGDLICEYKNDRVVIGGQARLYMEGRINF